MSVESYGADAKPAHIRRFEDLAKRLIVEQAKGASVNVFEIGAAVWYSALLAVRSQMSDAMGEDVAVQVWPQLVAQANQAIVLLSSEAPNA